MKRAVVIGSGPNGLAGAITLAQAGFEVEVREAEETIGGGARTQELTLPGFWHDTCSAIHPLGEASPVFRRLDLEIEWIHPPAAAAHPFDDGTAITLERDLGATASQLGGDGSAYRRLFGPLVEAWRQIEPVLVGPYPPSPGAIAALVSRLGLVPFQRSVRAALTDARTLGESRFATEHARGFFAGHAAHSMLPLERRPSSGFGLTLIVLGHAVGWGFPRGGAQAIPNALTERLRSLGGEIRTSSPVDELPRADVVLADVAPRELLRLGGNRLPARYAAALRRFRHGPGAFKLDWALDGPIPWRSEACRRAGTVHVGGTLAEIASSEWDACRGVHNASPFVLLAQNSVFDGTRAPPGKHTAWGYCHVPNGSTTDMTEAVEAQVERFAPGFRDLVLARSTMFPADLEARNRNLVGGDVGGGSNDLSQLLFRPVRKPIPYRTPLRGVYLCSASTPPGAGVHGMCGYAAARVALKDRGR